jgi:hypothetical protein
LKYDGWFPQLFYKTIYWSEDEFQLSYGSAAYDAIVTDVLTDLPNGNAGDPGSVLHEGVGRANMMFVAVDNGTDKFICAGPVLSHYEFEALGGHRRLTDEEWRVVLQGLSTDGLEGLKPPAWTRDYLSPSEFRVHP